VDAIEVETGVPFSVPCRVPHLSVLRPRITSTMGSLIAMTQATIPQLAI
jgi:hypothetical protein